MTDQSSYFFCGIGGSGMLPLALILKGRGANVKGSDRARDQGLSADKFRYLESLGIELYPQDGSGLTSSNQILVASAAIETSVPDVSAAIELGCRRMTRAEVLSNLFNQSKVRIGVAGTSGKSTVTGMIGWILTDLKIDPTVMNGAVMKNFVSDKSLFSSALVGAGSTFVSEVDESDGSIVDYSPTIAVLNNVSHDHKSMDELRALFGDFISKAEASVLNYDDPETFALRSRASKQLCYGIDRSDVDLTALNVIEAPLSVSFTVRDNRSGAEYPTSLQTPGRHNVSNSLAALCVGHALGLGLEELCTSISRFSGIRRRFDIVGTRNGVTVIDDFAHNPDKIGATLSTLRAFPGRLVVVFQPHGFGPLRTLRSELVEAFTAGLAPGDILMVPEPAYFGGTVDRSVSSSDLVNDLIVSGVDARHFEDRSEIVTAARTVASTGDRIIVMGARDDTLSQFATSLLNAIEAD